MHKTESQTSTPVRRIDSTTDEQILLDARERAQQKFHAPPENPPVSPRSTSARSSL